MGNLVHLNQKGKKSIGMLNFAIKQLPWTVQCKCLPLSSHRREVKLEERPPCGATIIMVLLATKKSCKKEVKALPVQGLEEKCSQETVPKGRVRLAVTGCHV